MALFPLCKTPTDFLHGRKAAASVKSPHPHFLALDRGGIMTDMMVIKAAVPQSATKTPWGAPIVWGDNDNSAWRRAKFAQQGIRAGLLALVVGSYSHFVRRFLASAEMYFLPGQMVTYYILTDSPRALDPPIELGPERQLKVVPVAEQPGWERLAHRRMALLADAIKDPISNEVEYIFCADVDQEFVATVGEEILGDLVATLHPELYGMPRNTFPYEVEEVSSACVEEDEGDYYYTSELYGGLVSEMAKLARTCSLLILQDQANRVVARGLEESYLNRYLIDHRPTCVLSPEYSWWDSALAADVPVQRLVSLGRQCESYDKQAREQHKC
ncbi:globoside alpha-1,3-N-acetylgalactosaminyltransferase 1-like isoform X2 [Trachinotus anak]|uniref:globoside alpha-1,3-N-acetylgalactosaminyltransferase 1-like isoform X2 n=1 Tax=Trachinotus anak TaxID=443729 RepID=UPI0039F2039F